MGTPQKSLALKPRSCKRLERQPPVSVFSPLMDSFMKQTQKTTDSGTSHSAISTKTTESHAKDLAARMTIGKVFHSQNISLRIPSMKIHLLCDEKLKIDQIYYFKRKIKTL